MGMGQGWVGSVGRGSSIHYYHEHHHRIQGLLGVMGMLVLVVVTIENGVTKGMGDSARGLNEGSWDGGFGIQGEGG